MNEPDTNIRQEKPSSLREQVTIVIKLAKLVKDYSLHSLLVVSISGFAYVVYERNAFETKLELKDNIIELKQEEISQLRGMLEQEKGKVQEVRNSTEIFLKRIKELHAVEMRLTNFSNNRGFNIEAVRFQSRHAIPPENEQE